MGWFVVDKFYTLSGQTPVYAAALLLDPSKRRKHIERNWQCNEIDELLSAIAITGPPLDGADDFETFIDAPPTRIAGSPLERWLHRDQRTAYPRLSCMAIDILSIPLESFDVESHFSWARRTLSWDRESTTCENLEKVECVGNWMREGIIVSKSHSGRGVVSSVAVEISAETEAEDFLD
ncbi:uncharacterized protein FFFS_15800 [Fusarium fujikuroi]|nr:uncharacterized protein FFFS_15800 [Fusarium fujikuroi]